LKLPAHRAGLPGNEISFLFVPLDPAYKAGLAGHLPANSFRELQPSRKIGEISHQVLTFPIFDGFRPICSLIYWVTLKN
jgi:hypothetical protein